MSGGTEEEQSNAILPEANTDHNEGSRPQEFLLANQSDRVPSSLSQSNSKSDGRSTPVASATSEARQALANSHIQSNSSPRMKPPMPIQNHKGRTTQQRRPVGARPHPHNRINREQFLIFTRILFKCLDEHPSPLVQSKAKAIVLECAKRNRAGDPNYHPLIDAVESRLRGIVGEVHWHKAVEYLVHYKRSKKGQATTTVAKGSAVDPSAAAASVKSSKEDSPPSSKDITSNSTANDVPSNEKPAALDHPTSRKL